MCFLEAQQQTPPRHKPLASTSEVHWQRANRSFSCTPLGLNTGPFCSPRDPEGSVSVTHHPWGFMNTFKVQLSKGPMCLTRAHYLAHLRQPHMPLTFYSSYPLNVRANRFGQHFSVVLNLTDI